MKRSTRAKQTRGSGKGKREDALKTRPREPPIHLSADPSKPVIYHQSLSFVRSASWRLDARLIAHLVIIVTTLVVLVVVFVILHLVGVLVAHFLPVDVLAAGAAAAGNDIVFGDGLQVVVGFLVVCGSLLVLWELGEEECFEGIEVSRRGRGEARPVIGP